VVKGWVFLREFCRRFWNHILEVRVKGQSVKSIFEGMNTHLDFLLSQSDAFYNPHACSLVGSRVALKLGLKDLLVFWAAKSTSASLHKPKERRKLSLGF
jgi:hypothetical protein